MLQFIVHLRPGIVIGIAISLVHLDRGRSESMIRVPLSSLLSGESDSIYFAS
jgi:hypothetical protein